MTRRGLGAAAVVALALVLAGAGGHGTQGTPPASAAAGRALDIRANVVLMDGGGASLLQRGTFAGAPLGRGTVSLRTEIGRGRGATFRFVLQNARGSVRGTGDVALVFRATTIIYRGTARITAGAGAFSRLRGTLHVDGRGPISSERFAVRLTGRVHG